MVTYEYTISDGLDYSNPFIKDANNSVYPGNNPLPVDTVYFTRVDFTHRISTQIIPNLSLIYLSGCMLSDTIVTASASKMDLQMAIPSPFNGLSLLLYLH